MSSSASPGRRWSPCFPAAVVAVAARTGACAAVPDGPGPCGAARDGPRASARGLWSGCGPGYRPVVPTPNRPAWVAPLSPEPSRGTAVVRLYGRGAPGLDVRRPALVRYGARRRGGAVVLVRPGVPPRRPSPRCRTRDASARRGAVCRRTGGLAGPSPVSPCAAAPARAPRRPASSARAPPGPPAGVSRRADSPIRSSAPGVKRTGRVPTRAPSSVVPFVESRSATATRPSGADASPRSAAGRRRGRRAGRRRRRSGRCGSGRRAAGARRPRRARRPHGAGRGVVQLGVGLGLGGGAQGQHGAVDQRGLAQGAALGVEPLARPRTAHGRPSRRRPRRPRRAPTPPRRARSRRAR